MPRAVILLVLVGCTSGSDAMRDRGNERASEARASEARATGTGVTVGVVADAAPVVAAGDGAVIAQVAADRTLTMTLPRPISGKPPVTAQMRLPDGWSQQPGARGEVTLRPVGETDKLPYMAVLVSAENLESGTVRQVLQRSVIAPLKTSVPDVEVRRVITDAHRDHRFVLSLEIESALTEPSRYVETRCLAYVDSGGFAVELKGEAAMDDSKLVDVFEAACASLAVQGLPAERSVGDGGR